MLRRRDMNLESYTCDNCIGQKEKTLYHLFLRCNFTETCWSSIGLTVPRISNPERASTNLKQQLNTPFFMEVIILMAWSIQKCRNGLNFENISPTVETCKAKFKKELLLVIQRAREKYDSAEWLPQIPHQISFLLSTPVPPSFVTSLSTQSIHICIYKKTKKLVGVLPLLLHSKKFFIPQKCFFKARLSRIRKF